MTWKNSLRWCNQGIWDKAKNYKQKQVAKEPWVRTQKNNIVESYKQIPDTRITDFGYKIK